MDLTEFDDLIDMYRHYQMHGNLNERSDSRRALKDAFRAIEAERDALRKESEARYQAGAEHVIAEAVRIINEAREEGESDLRCIRSRIMAIIEDQS